MTDRREASESIWYTVQKALAFRKSLVGVIPEGNDRASEDGVEMKNMNLRKNSVNKGITW